MMANGGTKVSQRAQNGGKKRWQNFDGKEVAKATVTTGEKTCRTIGNRRQRLAESVVKRLQKMVV